MRAAERDRPEVIRRRHQFLYRIGRQRVERLVFLDESGAKTNMTRLYGRAPREDRCHFAAPQGHWQTQTMLSAIRLTGPIEKATLVLHGPIDGDSFRHYIKEMLSPALNPGDVVIMDNLPAHKVTGVEESLTSVGATLCYLPPYSPDLNPIEKMWSKVKSFLRQAAARTESTLVRAIGDALRAASATNFRNYFLSCGYAKAGRNVL